MRFDPTAYAGHFVAEYIEPAADRWVVFAEAYDHSSTPLGPDGDYTLRIGRDGSAELRIRERNGYTGEQELLLVVRGQATIADLRADRFTLQLHDPTFELVQDGPGAARYIERFRGGAGWIVHRQDVR